MPNTTTSARTDTCQPCGSKLTHILTLQLLDDLDEPPNIAPFTCPKCGRSGTVAVEPGRRIVKVETKPYLGSLGR